jgi:hypothetical protein
MGKRTSEFELPVDILNKGLDFWPTERKEL